MRALRVWTNVADTEATVVNARRAGLSDRVQSRALRVAGNTTQRRVVDASGGERLARVRIRVDDVNHETVTNDVGEFSFADLEPLNARALLARLIN
jgi:hypothetical protein